MNLKKEEIIKIMKDANDMLNGIYYFDGLWNMEPCMEKIINKKIKWNISYNGDYEWTYMFTRMEYLYKLILAYEISHEEKYLNHGLKIINKWYKDNKKYLYRYIGKINNVLFKNNYAHRTLDLAMMCTNILDYVDYLKDNKKINQRKYNNYIKIIHKVINYLIPLGDNDDISFSNWSIIINGNVLYCLNKMHHDNILLEQRLLRDVHNQILTNGSHIESSPMYLVQSLLVLFKVISLENCHIKEELIGPVNKSCDYLSNISNLDNSIPNFGDSDITNISDILYIAKLYTNYQKCYINKDINLELSFKYNLPRNHKIDNINPDRLINYKNQTVYKNYKAGTYLLCSNIERRRDGHKHFDYMSVLYQEYGLDLLVDLGRYSYKNDSNRELLIGTSGHNITCVKDKYFKYCTNFVTSQRVDCLDNKLENNHDYFSIKMKSEYGYDNVNIERYVTYIYDFGLIITDMINDKLDNNYITYFNIGNDYKINKKILKANNNKVYYSNDLDMNYKIKDVLYSPRYNESESIKQMYFEFNCKHMTHYFLKKDLKIQTVYENNTIHYIFDDKKISIKRYENGI